VVEVGVEEGEGGIDGENFLIGAHDGEEEGGGFAGDAGDGQHDAGDDPGGGGGDDDAEEGLEFRGAQADGGFAEGMGDELEHFLGGAGDDGAHHKAEGDGTGPGRATAIGTTTSS